MSEYNLEVDQDDNPIGLRLREDFYTAKYIHRAAHLILFNSQNEILLQRRATTKKIYPNLFTYSVSGTVGNESYEKCLQREMQEEIGISIIAKKLFKYPFFDKNEKAWHCVVVGATDDKIIPEANVIQAIKWLDANKLKVDISQNPEKYTPPFIDGIKNYFKNFYQPKK
jgi:isopentenyldiphosphate isomerase